MVASFKPPKEGDSHLAQSFLGVGCGGLGLRALDVVLLLFFLGLGEKILIYWDLLGSCCMVCAKVFYFLLIIRVYENQMAVSYVIKSSPFLPLSPHLGVA